MKFSTILLSLAPAATLAQESSTYTSTYTSTMTLTKTLTLSRARTATSIPSASVTGVSNSTARTSMSTGFISYTSATFTATASGPAVVSEVPSTGSAGVGVSGIIMAAGIVVAIL